MLQQCDHKAGAIHVDSCKNNSTDRSTALWHKTQMNIALGQNEESKQSRDCQSGGCCREQRLQWLVRLPQDHLEKLIWDVWAEDEAEPYTWLVIHPVKFLKLPQWTYAGPRTARVHFTVLPTSWAQLLLPGDRVGSSVCAVDCGNDYRDEDDDEDDDGDDY